MNIPDVVINIILEFKGYHRLRNGKYMKQIPKFRMNRLHKKIIKMPKIVNGYVELRISNTLSEFIIGPSFYYDRKSTRL